LKTNLFLSAFAAVGILSSGAAFAQSAPASVVTLKPGQTVDGAGPAQTAPAVVATQSASDVGVVNLKPGETFGTASQADLGATQAGATSPAS
jgi:hypothetical protein